MVKLCYLYTTIWIRRLSSPENDYHYGEISKRFSKRKARFSEAGKSDANPPQGVRAPVLTHIAQTTQHGNQCLSQGFMNSFVQLPRSRAVWQRIDPLCGKCLPNIDHLHVVLVTIHRHFPAEINAPARLANNGYCKDPI